MLGILDVGHQLGALGRHHRCELACDPVSRRLERCQPGEESARVKLAFGEAAEVELGGFAVERARSAQDVAAEPGDPRALFLVTALTVTRGKHPRLALVAPLGHPRLAARDHRRQLGGQLAIGPLRQCILPCLVRARIAQPFEQAGAHQQSGEVERCGGEREFDRFERGSRPGGGAA